MFWCWVRDLPPGSFPNSALAAPQNELVLCSPRAFLFLWQHFLTWPSPLLPESLISPRSLTCEVIRRSDPLAPPRGCPSKLRCSSWEFHTRSALLFSFIDSLTHSFIDPFSQLFVRPLHSRLGLGVKTQKTWKVQPVYLDSRWFGVPCNLWLSL